MNSTVDFRRFRPFPLAGHSFGARRGLRFAFGSGGFLVALIAYCELCSIAHGLPPPGLAISGLWAVQVSLGWIILGAALAMFGERVVSSRFAGSHPRTLILTAVAAMAAFAILCETLLAYWIGDSSRLLPFLNQRLPVALAASAILVAVYVADRIWKQKPPGMTPPSEPVEEQLLPEEPIEAPATKEQAPEEIEVMTGTGRTMIRVSDIECLQADRNYLTVATNGREYLLRRTIAAAEGLLDPNRFVRIHRSTIVNREKIKERRPGGILVLLSGRTVSIGRAFRHRL